MADDTALLALGDPRNSHLGTAGSTIEHHPVGMDFYKRDWPMDRLGQVRYLQDSYSFGVTRVSDVMGSLDREDPERGIYAWGMNAFPMDGERIPHQLARDRLFELLGTMRRAGWRRFLSYSNPRLTGSQAVRYAIFKHGVYSLDPDYKPDMQEWMRLNEFMPCWDLWAEGTYLTLMVMDEPALRRPDQPGVYMFSINIQSESAEYQRYFTEVEDMRRWKQLIPPEIQRLQALRAGTEASLRTQGYVIDETYRDPPILALGQGA